MKPSKIFLLIIIVISIFLIAHIFMRSKKSSDDLYKSYSSHLNTDSNQNENIATAQSLSSVAKKSDISENSHLNSLVQNLKNDEVNKWITFESLLKNKNDNDPRIDTELKNTSMTFHETLFLKYDSLQNEDRSGKGLVTYLVARDLSSTNDAQFLKKIYQEAPCLSLSDCKTISQNNDPHHTSTDQTTLVYPQLNALYVIEKNIKDNPQLLDQANYRSWVTQILSQAENFPVPAVQNKARDIQHRYNL